MQVQSYQLSVGWQKNNKATDSAIQVSVSKLILNIFSNLLDTNIRLYNMLTLGIY